MDRRFWKNNIMTTYYIYVNLEVDIWSLGQARELVAWTIQYSTKGRKFYTELSIKFSYINPI